MTFHGPWPAGPIQKVDRGDAGAADGAAGLHPFHSSAVRYRDKTVLFLGGESNHGKTMGQIEACRRGALLVSTETTVIDDDGRAVLGSKAPSSSRSEPRAPSAPTRRRRSAASRSSSARCRPGSSTEPSNVDVVIVPAIDGNYEPAMAEMIPFERQFQTFHSVQNYFLLNELLAPGFPMPLVDTEALRRARAGFVERFS